MTFSICISDEVYTKWPKTSAAFVLYELNNTNSINELSPEQCEILTNIPQSMSIEHLKGEQIQTTKEAIKAFGRSPSKYRGSAEALLRRVSQGNGIGQINRVVDMNNIISITHALPLGSYNLCAICGNACIDIGQRDEHYETINKGMMRLEGMLIIRDEHGAFGSIHADSKRTMVYDCKELLTVIFCFSHNHDALNKALEDLVHHASTYLKANIKHSGII